MTGSRSPRFSRHLTDGGVDDSPTASSDLSSTTEMWGWGANGVVWVADSVSDTELLQVVVDLATDGCVSSRQDVIEHSSFHPAVYVRRFGSWTAALEKANVLPGRVEGLLDEEVMEELHALAGRLGHPPTPNDVDEVDVSVDDILSRFGRWNNALAEARVDLVSVDDLTEEEQFLLYKKEVGQYRTGYGEQGFFRGWEEHHAVLEFLTEQGEKRFTVSQFASGVGISEERAAEMLEFVDSLGVIRRDEEGWDVRVDEQEEVAGWLRGGKSQY